MELLGFLLKLIAPLATAAFGFLALGTKARDDEERLTRSGYIAVVGMVVTAVLSFAIQTNDFLAARKASQAEMEQSRKTLIAVQQGQYPLRNMTATFSLLLPHNNRLLTVFRNKLRQTISKDRKCHETPHLHCHEGVESLFDGLPASYSIDPESSLFPTTWQDGRWLLQHIQIGVTMYGTTSELKDTKIKYKEIGDFLISWTSEQLNASVLFFNYENDELRLLFVLKVPDSVLADSAPKSLVDVFPGAAVAQIFPNDNCTYDIDTCNILKDHIRDTSIENLSLSFPFPKTLFFDKKINCNGRSMLGTILPKSIDLPAISENAKEEIDDLCKI